jgi:hypothetical protein
VVRQEGPKLKEGLRICEGTGQGGLSLFPTQSRLLKHGFPQGQKYPREGTLPMDRGQVKSPALAGEKRRSAGLDPEVMEGNKKKQGMDLHPVQADRTVQALGEETLYAMADGPFSGGEAPLSP